MTNPADTTHVRFAALQNLCNKELMLDKYMKGYPDNDDEKATREMSNGGARMSVNGFNYCQLVYLRDTFKVGDTVVSNYTDTLLSLCPETVKVNKEMASLPMTMGFARYDNRYGEPLIFAERIKTALQADIALIRSDECKLCGLDGDTTLENLFAKMTSAQEQVNMRLSELWKAEGDFRLLDRAKVFMLVKGVDPDERESKRTRRVKQ
jgi:hypothetical protein